MIKIVTDSTADIPLSVREEYGIEMVPLKVHFGEETYLDAVTIHPEQFYDKLSKAEQLPTTSQPSPVDFLDTYKKLSIENDIEIISIHLSSALSGTYQSAVLAKSILEDKASVTIIDSKSASYGLGLLVIAAAEAVRQGKSKAEIIRLIQELRNGTKIYFVVDTLEYLKKGGRIGKASALLGSLLNIKPILTVNEAGEAAPLDKVRGHRKAMLRIIELMKEEFKGTEIKVTVGHCKAQDTADELSLLVKEHFQINDIKCIDIGPVIGTHVGPGTAAVFAHFA